MDTILEMLSRGVEQLLGRADGPMHFRLVVMPIVVTTLAVRAGLMDAREGRPAFLWAILINPAKRRASDHEPQQGSHDEQRDTGQRRRARESVSPVW